jgi:thymidylate synthase
MALYRHDYSYEEGKRLLDELQGEEGELVRYYVAENEKRADKVQRELDEIREVLTKLGKFIN